MTDNEPSTEKFAWVRDAYRGLSRHGAGRRSTEQLLLPTMAAVSGSGTAMAHNGSTAAHVRPPRGRAPWVRWSPWIALIAAICIVIVLEQRRRTDLARSERVAALSRTRLFSSIVQDPSGRRTRAPISMREPSAQLNATPSTTVPAHHPTIANPPRTSEGGAASHRLMAPSQIAAVAPSLSTSQERAVDGLDSASATSVVRILDSAQARGLPIDGAADRIHEGVRRGVPTQQIVGVARNYVASLDSARTALGASATVAEVQIGAEALLAGTPPGALRQLSAPPVRRGR